MVISCPRGFERTTGESSRIVRFGGGTKFSMSSMLSSFIWRVLRLSQVRRLLRSDDLEDFRFRGGLVVGVLNCCCSFWMNFWKSLLFLNWYGFIVFEYSSAFAPKLDSNFSSYSDIYLTSFEYLSFSLFLSSLAYRSSFEYLSSEFFIFYSCAI